MRGGAWHLQLLLQLEQLQSWFGQPRWRALLCQFAGPSFDMGVVPIWTVARCHDAALFEAM